MTLAEIARKKLPEEQAAWDAMMQAHVEGPRESIPTAAAIWNDIADRIMRGGFSDPLEYAV